MIIADNYWIGDNELVIRFRNGIHVVLEKYEDYEVVFTGHYEKCHAYCREREIKYLDSLF